MSANFFKVRNGLNVGVLTADPSGGAAGDMYYNSTTSKLREFVNGSWRDAVTADDTQTLSNKTLDNTTVETIKDSNLTVQNATDTTKQLKFDVSGVTTGQTRSLAVPDANTTIVGTGITQTLSNKTLDNTTIETLKDSNWTMQNASDTTKQMKFDASGITTGTTRTLSAPDVSSTLLARTSVDQGSNRVQNKDLDASNTKVVDNSDTTKKLAFQTSGSATAVTTTLAAASTVARTLTLPDATDTLAALAATQVLSNKQISLSSSNDSTTTGSAATLQAFTTGIIRLTNASLTSVAGIPAGGSGQQLVLENKTGNQISINNEDATATAANRIQTGTGSPLAMPNNATVILSYDNTSARWQLASGSGSGSGSGGKNYLSSIITSTSAGAANTGNGNFEFGSTTGWSLAKTALSSLIPSSVGTGSNPFSSSNGGSAVHGTFTVAIASGGSQIGGSYSALLADSAAGEAGDMLISSAAFIDAEDQGQQVPFSFSYKNTSGTQSFSGTSTNTWAVYFYDVTNNTWIQPIGVYNMVKGSGVGTCTGTFTTSSNGTRYQMALVEINAPAGAFSLTVDDFVFGSGALPATNYPSSQVTRQVFSSGTSQTYTTPFGVQYIRVRMVGGGGGGAGAQGGTSGFTASGSGTASTFGGILSAGGGTGTDTNFNPGTGGSSSVSAPAIQLAALAGGSGAGTTTGTANVPGGKGGDSAFGGGGAGGTGRAAGGSAGGAASPNTGGGGGGQGGSSGTNGAPGGGAGGYVDAIIINPATSYTYTVGAAGGAAGSGGSGAAGLIIVEEYYNPYGVAGQGIGINGTVAGAVGNGASEVLNSGINSYLPFGAVLVDTNNTVTSASGTFSAATGQWSVTNPSYKIPVSGVYKIAARSKSQFTTANTSSNHILAIWKNGSAIQQNLINADGSNSANLQFLAIDVDTVQQFNAGDVINIIHNTNVANGVATVALDSFSCVLQGTGIQATQNRVFQAPAVSVFTGSGTYSAPIGAVYLVVKATGGGGGGGSTGTGVSGTAGGTGGTTSFVGTGTSVSVTGGGGGGTSSTGPGTPAVGGSGSGGNIRNMSGTAGADLSNGSAINVAGPPGGPSFLGGAGRGGTSGGGTGVAAGANSGSGGGGAGGGGTVQPGKSGAGGGYSEHLISSPNPSTVYTVTVGGAGGGGSAGSSGGGGGSGGAGLVEVWAYFQ